MLDNEEEEAVDVDAADTVASVAIDSNSCFKANNRPAGWEGTRRTSNVVSLPVTIR
jgi:hypothetical protein